MTIASALPFLAFAAFLVIFRVQARREGKTINQYLDDRNRKTFSHRGPRVFLAICFAIVAAGVIAALVLQIANA